MAAIVIPARYGSTRFPGKPMHPILGIPMLERVWRIARAVKNCDRIVVATESVEVADFARSFGAEAVITSDRCRNGTERVHEATGVAGIADDIVVNLQGDAVLSPPWVLEAMIEAMMRDAGIEVITPAVQLEGATLAKFATHKVVNKSSGTTVVFDRAGNALYFSKQILPFIRTPGFSNVHRHVGLYGYRRRLLAEYCKLAPSPLEETEGLEQLRLLENGLKIRVLKVDYRGRTHASIDTYDDVRFAEDIIASEGELF
jgi:3-deoxy-manno-octulosonate cytidylyltransferase (CMP-KDO synthetase)